MSLSCSCCVPGPQTASVLCQVLREGRGSLPFPDYSRVLSLLLSLLQSDSVRRVAVTVHFSCLPLDWTGPSLRIRLRTVFPNCTPGAWHST